jgi:hypothetical protein
VTVDLLHKHGELLDAPVTETHVFIPAAKKVLEFFKSVYLRLHPVLLLSVELGNWTTDVRSTSHSLRQ